MFVILFILVLVQGLVSSEERNGINPRSCFEIFRNHEIKPFTHFIPNSEELLLRCPVTKEHIDCRIRTFSETEYFEMDNLLSIRSMLDDICNETSQLYQGYVNNFDCFKSVVDEWDGCKGIASSVVEEFRKSSYAFQNTDLYAAEEEGMKLYRTFAEGHCLLNAHSLACIGMKIQETCGQGAYEIYVEITTRGQFANEFCDSYAVKHFIKGYLDYLSKENKPTEIDIIRDLFNVETDSMRLARTITVTLKMIR